jgi:hypothetical protein
MQPAELVTYLFQNKKHFLSAQVAEWAQASRRFRAWAEAHKDKIRKKARTADGEAGLRDLALELSLAYALLADARCELDYEAYAATKGRSPDFTVTFRVNTRFNLEATRIRSTEGDLNARLMRTVCEKVGQMPPSIINVLAVAAEHPIAEGDIAGAMAALRLLAERKEDEFFVRRGFEDAADFLRQFRRLSGILARSQPAAPDALWANPLAKHPLPRDIENLLVKLPV